MSVVPRKKNGRPWGFLRRTDLLALVCGSFPPLASIRAWSGGSIRHQPPDPPPPRNPPPEEEERDEEEDEDELEEEEDDELDERLDPHDRVVLELERMLVIKSKIHQKPEPSASTSSSIGINRLKLKRLLIPAMRARIVENAARAKTASGSSKIHQRCFMT